MVNYLAHKPTHNGCIGDGIPEELEKHNEGHKIHEKTKTIDGPTTEHYHRLGTDTNDYHEFIPLVEGSFVCSACKRTCCKHFLFNTKLTQDDLKRCVSCERNTSDMTATQINSENETKKN